MNEAGCKIVNLIFDQIKCYKSTEKYITNVEDLFKKDDLQFKKAEVQFKMCRYGTVDDSCDLDELW